MGIPIVGASPLPSLHLSRNLTSYSGQGLGRVSTSSTPGALVPGTGMGWEWRQDQQEGGGSEALRTELNSTDCEHVWFIARREPEKRNHKSVVLEACICVC